MTYPRLDRNGLRRRPSRSGLNIALTVILIVAFLAAGAYFDIAYMLVGGILRIVHGASGPVANAEEIAWGAVRVICSGVGIFLAALAGFAVWELTEL